MPLVAEYRTQARPDRRILEVYDADAYLDDEQALAAARSQVVAGNGYHLYLHSLQDVLKATIAIRIWDTPPDEPADAEGSVPITLESETGILVIRAFTAGPVGEMALPQPGVYGGYASWIGRQATRDHCHATLHALAEDASTEEADRAWAQTPTTEAYTLDLCYLRPPEGEDEEE
ncbi:hypothetical protein [Streptomyces violens]|uniref:hypothetical protein n=1 Tax=Streptomyces violens TaxID=66377 RepID=UPI0004BE70F1|nr:hypothetical protein [Streptomyces violens]